MVPGATQSLLEYLFHNWSWSRTAQACRMDAFTHGGDVEKCEDTQQMSEKGLRRMAWAEGEAAGLFRLPSWREANSTFCEQLHASRPRPPLPASS